MSNKDDLIKITYQALRTQGFSHKGALAMVGEIGRENSFNEDFIFGSHTDDKNNKTNSGIISFQGDRKEAFEKYMADKGFYKDGKITRSADSLNAQVDFTADEMKKTNPQLFKKLQSDDIDPNQAMDEIGRGYIKWRIDDPKYRTDGLINRSNHYNQGSKLVGDGSQVSAPIYTPTTELAKQNADVVAQTGTTAGEVDYNKLNERRAGIDYLTEKSFRDMLEAGKREREMEKAAKEGPGSLYNATYGIPVGNFNVDPKLNYKGNTGDNRVSYPDDPNIQEVDQSMANRAGQTFAENVTKTMFGLKNQSDNGNLDLINKYLNPVGQIMSVVDSAMNQFGETNSTIKMIDDRITQARDAVRQTIYPEFKPDANYDYKAYAEKRGARVDLLDETYQETLRNTKSRQEFDYYYGLASEAVGEKELAMKDAGMVAQMGYAVVGDILTNPVSIVAGALTGGVATAAMATKAGKAALTAAGIAKNSKAAGIVVENFGDAVGYAGGELLQGRSYTAKETAGDVIFGSLLSFGLRGSGAIGSTAFKRVQNIIDKEGYEAKAKIDDFNSRSATFLDDFSKKNPNASPEDTLKAYRDKFKDDEVFNEYDNTGLSYVDNEKLNAKPEDLKGEVKVEYENSTKVYEENEANKRTLEEIEAKKKADDLQEQKNKETNELKAKSDLASEEVVAELNDKYNSLYPEEQKYFTVEMVDGKPVLSFIAKNTSSPLKERINTAMSNVAKYAEEVRAKTEAAVKSFVITPELRKSMTKSTKAGSKTHTRITDADGVKHGVNYKGDDFLEVIAMRDFSKKGKLSPKLNKLKKALNDAGFSDELLGHLHKKMREAELKASKNSTVIDFVGTGRKVGKNKVNVLDGKQIYSRKDAIRDMKAFQNKQTKVLYKQLEEERDRKFFEEDWHFDISLSDVEKREKVKADAENAKSSDEYQIPFKPKGNGGRFSSKKDQATANAVMAPKTPPVVKTRAQIADEAKLHELVRNRYINGEMEFADALNRTMMMKASDRYAGKIERTINSKKRLQHLKKLDGFVKRLIGGQWQMESADGWVSRLLAPSNLGELSQSADIRHFAYAVMENPIGAVSKNTSVVMKQMHEFTVLTRSARELEKNVKNEWNARNGVSVLAGVFKEPEINERFNTDFAKYRKLSKEMKESHANHDIFSKLDNKMTEWAKYETQLMINAKLPGYQLVKNVSEEQFSNYFPFKIHHEKFMSLTKGQQDAFVNHLAKEFALDGKDALEASRIAETIRKRLLDRELSGSAVNLDKGAHADNFLNDIINSIPDMSPARKQELIEKAAERRDNQKLSRADIDTSKEIEVPPGENSFKIDDLLDNDIWSGMQRKLKNTIGAYHMDQSIGLVRDSDFATFIDNAIRRGATEAEIESVKAVRAEVLGQQYAKHGGQGWRILSSFLRSVMLGWSGFTQLIEYANILNSLGVRGAYRNIRDTFKNYSNAKKLARGQEVDSEIITAFSKFGYIPGENVYAQPFFNYDMVRNGVAFNPSEMSLMSTFASKMERMTRSIENIVASLSLQKQVLAAQQIGLAEELAKTAFLKAMHPDKSMAMRDFAQAGLDYPGIRMLVDKGIIKQKDGQMIGFDLTKMSTAEDAIAMKNFQNSVTKLSSSIIQETLPGEVGRWVHNDMFKAMMMMRSFSLTAQFKQFSRIQNTHGWTGLLAQTLGSSLTSSLVLSGRSYLKMQNMDEERQDEYAEKNLNPRNALLKGLSYSSTLGMGQDVINTVTLAFAPGVSEWGDGKNLASSVLPIVGGSTGLAQAGIEVTGSIVPAVGTLFGRERKEKEKFDSSKVTNYIPGYNTVGTYPLRYAFKQAEEAYLDDSNDASGYYY